MTLTLHRLSHSRHGTFGVLTVNGEKPVYTLEETELQVPQGRYQVELTYSPHFHRVIPLLSVPNRLAIRIHEGNWSRDSSGCILLGKVRGTNMLLRSREAVDEVTNQIQIALTNHQQVWIVIQ